MGNLHLVTGYAGEAHVASSDQGSLFEALIRSGQFVLEAGAKFAASIVSNNQIRVNDGELLMQGRHVKLTPGAYVDLAVENGAQGYLRNDLIVVRYTRNSDTGIEECNLVVLKGTQSESNPADPEYTIGSLNADGAQLHDFPIYRISLSGLSIETLQALFEPKKSLYDEILTLNNALKSHTDDTQNPHKVTVNQVKALPNTTESLKNPYKLTINGATYDGSEAKDMTDIINELIEDKFAEIGIAEEGSY